MQNRDYKKAIEVRCFAKINFFLRVCGRRDDGFHEIVTILHTVDVADRLFFEKKEPSASEEFQVTRGEAPIYSENLVGRAVELLRAEFPDKIPPLRIELEKTIPSGAGLGGGSADAASTLAALNQMLSLDLEDSDLEVLAARLGSDVPFFIRGGMQVGRGRGDRLEPKASCEEPAFVIVKPKYSISTAEAYNLFQGRTFDPLPSRSEIEDRIQAIREHKWEEALENSFEGVLLEKYSEISRVKNRLMDHGCETALLSGSGSAIFGIASSLEDAGRIRGELKEDFEFVEAAAPTTQGQEVRSL